MSRGVRTIHWSQLLVYVLLGTAFILLVRAALELWGPAIGLDDVGRGRHTLYDVISVAIGLLLVRLFDRFLPFMPSKNEDG